MDSQIQAYLRFAASRQRNTERIDPFLATFSDHNDNRFLPFRRRGVAGALTTRLVREAFDVGVSVAFLMAAHEAEARIYIRAGFSPIGEILHISRPRM